MKTEIEQRQYRRFSLLFELYKEVRADASTVVALDKIGADHDIKNGLFKEAFDYLLQERFIRKTGSSNYTVSITHAGKKIVERVVTCPDDLIDNFPPYKDMGI